MKYKGKAISGSSILTILGVVCFTTIIVSAAVLMASTTWINTVPPSAGAVSKTTAFGGTALPDAPIKDQAYTFGLQVVSDIDTSTGYLKVTITASSILAANVVLVYDANDDHSYVEAALVADTVTTPGSLIYTVTGPLIWTSSSDVTYDFQITYTAANTYTVVGAAYAS